MRPTQGTRKGLRVIPSSPPRPAPRSGRRTRRLRQGAAAVGAAAVVVAGLALQGPSAQADTTSGPASAASTSVGTDSGSRARAFAAAAQEYGVPLTVLEAVSYAQTRWDFRPGHSTSGGFGPMHLVDASLGSPQEGRGLGEAPDASGAPDATPAADTLGRAAELTGLSEDALRSDELANIRGGAALLADTQRRLGLATGTSSEAGDWYATVADASGAAEQETAAAFADDAYSAVAEGASRTTNDGKV